MSLQYPYTNENGSRDTDYRIIRNKYNEFELYFNGNKLLKSPRYNEIAAMGFDFRKKKLGN